MFLGISDSGIILAYALSFLSAVACVVYGLVNWNKGAEKEPEQVAEEASWEEKDHEMDDKM